MKIELQNITKCFGNILANDDVSLTVEAGTIHGLLGENGAGKSTLVKILSGFLRRDKGNIILQNKVIEITTPAAAIQAGIGMLHQDPLDFPSLSVLDNFIIGKVNRNFILPKRQAARELRELAIQFNFDLDINEILGNLTVGERQQVEILRLLSLGVNTLILDEPTTGISVTQKDALFAAMKQLAVMGKSVIFVSHKLEDVEILCDRVTVMRQGKVVGNANIPCPLTHLVDMMFGREIASPNKPETTGDDIILHLNNITIKDNRLPVKINNLQVKSGEVIGLAGLEGNGQRLLLLLCAGLLQTTSGTIQINNKNLTHQSYLEYLKAGVSFLPADRLKEGLISGLSINDHVVLRQAQDSLFVNNKSSFSQSNYLIQLFNIRGKPETKVERLSGGNQQRTQLALLPASLSLLLMEHPTRGLDIESSIWVWQQLINRCEGGTVIIFISSDLDELMQYSDRLLVFSGGNVSEPINTDKVTAAKLGEMIGGNLGFGMVTKF